MLTGWLGHITDISNFCLFFPPAEETPYSKRWVKFSGKSPFCAPAPSVNQSLSLNPVSQPASCNNNHKQNITTSLNYCKDSDHSFVPLFSPDPLLKQWEPPTPHHLSSVQAHLNLQPQSHATSPPAGRKKSIITSADKRLNMLTIH